MLCLIMISCCSCSTKQIIKPEPVTVYVEKYRPVPVQLLTPAPPVVFDGITWRETILELMQAVDVCHSQLERIKNLTHTDEPAAEK